MGAGQIPKAALAADVMSCLATATGQLSIEVADAETLGKIGTPTILCTVANNAVPVNVSALPPTAAPLTTVLSSVVGVAMGTAVASEFVAGGRYHRYNWSGITTGPVILQEKNPTGRKTLSCFDKTALFPKSSRQ